jgi:molecular chaperone DnaK
MPSRWAIDLGTTNTVVAVWDEEHHEPRVVALPDIARPLILTETPVVPSAVYVRRESGWLDRMGQWRFIEPYWFLGQQGYIGQIARDMNYDGRSSAYAQSFKPLLGRESQRIIAYADGRRYSVRRITHIFLRELLAAIQRTTGYRPRDLTITAPVDSYETYRAELQSIAHRLGILRFRTLDEPVAAAMGYGLNFDDPRLLLVFDFGGGTLDVAILRTGQVLPERQTRRALHVGPAEVFAKQSLALGGDHVDVWVLEYLCRKIDCPIADWSDSEWYLALLDESRRVKEQLYSQEEATLILPPKALHDLGVKPERARPSLARDEFVELLRQCGLYRDLDRVLDQLMEEAAQRGVEPRDVDEVLMVGGSTLLPEVHSLLEARFGRDRLRDWLPFEAVGHGACVFAAGYRLQDFIRHDYALLAFNAETKEAEYPIIIPRGTPYPTVPDFHEDFYTPTCPRNEPAYQFELKIYEISGAERPQRELVWDQRGRLRVAGPDTSSPPALVCLNEANPTLGELNPPHRPEQREARLRIAFGVNAERWLCATVVDLLRGATLMDQQPVVRLR